jgi:hypothetical protein
MPKPSESEAVASPWVTLHEAVRQAGSLDALTRVLREGSVFARHNGLYQNGRIWRPGAPIASSWWAESAVRDINPEAGRATFVMDVLGVSVPLVAIGIEVERAALFAVFPAPPSEKSDAADGHDPEAQRSPLRAANLTPEFPDNTSGRIAQTLWEISPKGRCGRVDAMRAAVERRRPDLKPVSKRSFEEALRLLAELDSAKWPKQAKSAKQGRKSAKVRKRKS